MIFWFFRLARKLQRAIAADRQPKLLARGIAAGFLLGLVPAGNLISITIVIFIFCLRMNHAVAALTAITIALAAPIADPITHWLGTQILGAPHLAPLLSQLWQQPLIPWAEINNTVVTGSLVLGLVIYLPLQRGAKSVFECFIEDESETPAMQDELNRVSKTPCQPTINSDGSPRKSNRSEETVQLMPGSSFSRPTPIVHRVLEPLESETGTVGKSDQDLQALLKRLKAQSRRQAS